MTKHEEKEKETCDTAKFVKEAALKSFLRLIEETKHLEPEDGIFAVGEMCPGEQVYILVDYRFIRATVQKVSRKNIVVDLEADAIPGHIKHSRKVSREKVVRFFEKIAVVWERWKGKNGRGAYRIERELYPQVRESPQKWLGRKHIWEDSYGVLNPKFSVLPP